MNFPGTFGEYHSLNRRLVTAATQKEIKSSLSKASALFSSWAYIDFSANKDFEAKIIRLYGIENFKILDNGVNLALSFVFPFDICVKDQFISKSVISAKDKVKVSVIVFRGTSKGSEVLQDLKISEERVTLEKRNYVDAVQGFVEGFEGLMKKTDLPKTISINEKASDGFVLVTGHSLGGALANLMSIDLFENYKSENTVNENRLALFTFGEPRSLTLSSVEKLVRTHRCVALPTQKPIDNNEYDYVYHRYVNHNDIIPTVPGAPIFSHRTEALFWHVSFKALCVAIV